MNKISSKYLSLSLAEAAVNIADKKTQFNINGLLLITAFGMIYGEPHSPSDDENQKTLADILITMKSKQIQDLEKDNVEVFSDGSSIVLKNAIVRYSTGITLNMNEVIIFSDQVIGYYPVDLKIFEAFLNQH